MGVCASVDNCRLFVGGIPKTKKREEILSEMKKVTEGVVDVIVYPSAADKTKNRGFAFVEYESHRAAAMARRRLLPGKPFLNRDSQLAADPGMSVPVDLPLSSSSCLFLSQLIQFHKMLIDVYFGKVTPLHIRRTLIDSNPTENPPPRNFLRLKKPIMDIAA